MKKLFSFNKLQELVKPYDLHDVLITLMENNLIEEYSVEYLDDTIELVIPKDVEIREVMAGFQNVVESGRKSKGDIH